MTPAQRATYFGSLWPAACAAQGWDQLTPAQREEKRREITRAATGHDSTTALDNKQISRLFARLNFLAKPTDLAAARADSSPAETDAAHQARQLIWKIEQTARRKTGVRLNDEYISLLAAWYCRAHRTSQWRQLPPKALHLLLMRVNQRANAKDPTVTPRGRHVRIKKGGAVEYTLHPTIL